MSLLIEEEEEEWKLARNRNTTAAYLAYLARHPFGRYAAEAENNLQSPHNVLAGQSHSINLGIDESLPQDSPNTYFWEKDGKPYDTLIGVNRLVFPRLKISDAGLYTFKFINPNAPRLTLYGYRIRINVNCPPNAKPIAIASSRESLCLGDTLKLSIDKKLYTNIRWNNGQTVPAIAPKLTQSTTFSLTANDTLGCTNTGSKTIDVFNKPKLRLLQVTENCSDRLEPEVDGGFPPYRFTWSNNSNTSTINLTTLGNYSLTVTDVKNCKVTDTILVANLSKRFVLKDSLSIMPSCNQTDGTIWLSVSPRNQTYSYQWTPATMGQGQNPRTQLSRGQYKVLVRNSLGCADSLTLDLQGRDCNDEVRIFPTFTPNGDQVNEIFEIRPINCPQRTLAECFPNNELIILNRSNHAIYQKSPYNNDWDGDNYPIGSYYYVFYPDRNNQKNRMTGWLTLLR
jgi:gliding motility-associated-like protein